MYTQIGTCDVQIPSFPIVLVTHIFGDYVAGGESGSLILLQFKAAATKCLSQISIESRIRRRKASDYKPDGRTDRNSDGLLLLS